MKQHVNTTKIRTFPTKLVAMIFGFKEKPYFKSVEGAANAPTVNLINGKQDWRLCHYLQRSIDKKQLEAAIARLEQQTSAEFRILSEQKIPSKPTALSARTCVGCFSQLEIHQTAARNGVLIYIAYTKSSMCHYR